MERVEPEKEPKARKKREPSAAKRACAPSPERLVMGVLIGDNPATGDDVAAAWGLGALEARSTSIQILRLRIGTRQWELIQRCPLPDYNLGRVAGDFGPGTYCVKLAPGCPAHLRNKNATINVSEELARENGWGKVEAPAAPQAPDVYALQAARTAQNALQRGVDPLDLATMIQTAVDRALQARGPAAVPPDPMAQMQQMESMFSMMARLEKSVAARFGHKTEEDVPEQPWYMGLLQAATPVLGAIAANLTAPRAAAVPQPPPQNPGVPTLPPPQAAAPEAPVYQYSEADKAILSPAAATLRPFLPHLANLDKGQPASQLADELAPWIPPSLYGAVVRLSELAQQDTAALAGVIGSNLATERWRDVIGALAATLGPLMQEGEG